MNYNEIEVNDLVSHFGSKTNVAKHFGLSKGAVTQWGDFLPERWALDLKVKNPNLFNSLDCVKRMKSLAA